MSTNDSSRLVDEDEIRAAVRFFSIDREAFGRRVRERIEQTERIELDEQPQSAELRIHADDSETPNNRGGLLRIAASVLPVNLLGGASAAQTTLTAVGGLKKVFALLAIPTVSLLMIVVTIGSLMRIRNAQMSEQATDANLMQQSEAVTGWWRRYGLLAGIVFGFAVLAPFLGWTTPLLLVFIASAVATTSLVVTLGKAGLVNRATVGAYCIPILGLLGQVSVSLMKTNQTALLDPLLVTVTCFGGAGILALFVSPVVRDGNASRSNWLFRIGFSLMCCVGFVFGTQTIWRPISNESIVHYVESFEPVLLGQWATLKTTVDWLDDQGIEFDHTDVRRRLLSASEDEKQERYLFSTAVSTRLIAASEHIEMPKVVVEKQRLLAPRTAGRSLISVGQREAVITILAEAGKLSPSQKDHLSGRLMASWNEMREASKPGRILEDADVITRMLAKLGRSPEFSQRAADVRRWLSMYQVTRPRVFSAMGGFQAYYQTPSDESAHSSDPQATAAGVRLMETYGQTDAVDLLALRSYLRPRLGFGLMPHTQMMRASTLARLNRVPGIAQPTVWDHLVRDRALWFAILMVGLCLYATLGAPDLNRPASEAH